MALIPHTFFPRRMFDMDTWLPSTVSGLSPLQSAMIPSTLDVFDPFDELDRMMSRNLRWIDRPASILPALLPVVPQKYRITVECPGYNADNIKTELKEQHGRHVLKVHGKEETGKKGSDDYSTKEIKKTFTLPANIEHEKMVSFMTPGGHFVIEFPLRETAMTPNLGLLPQIMDVSGGGKQVQMQFPLPENIDPSKVQVSIKDRDLIMRVEDSTETPDSISRVHIFNRTTLPENTDLDAIKCVIENNQLRVTAPVNLQMTGSGMRSIQPEVKKTQQQIGGTGTKQQMGINQ